jgi:hypothetical protein
MQTHLQGVAMPATRFNRQFLPGGRRTSSLVDRRATATKGAPRHAGATSARQLVDALDGLSTAVVEATGSWAFLASERIQLIDAAHKLAWLLLRVNRNEPVIARHPHTAAAAQATITATHKVLAVTRLGDGEQALSDLFDLTLQVDELLPPTAKIFQ